MRFMFLLLMFGLTGCATMIRGTEQPISINTTPVGATLQLSNGASCSSPCTVTVPRNQAVTITISRAGCQTQTATMVPTLAGAGVIFGGLIDYGTGAVYDLQPNPLTVTLGCRDQITGLPITAPPASISFDTTG